MMQPELGRYKVEQDGDDATRMGEKQGKTGWG